MPDLLPCPRCHSSYITGKPTGGGFRVQCQNLPECGLSVWKSFQFQATATWNTRAKQDEARDE